MFWVQVKANPEEYARVMTSLTSTGYLFDCQHAVAPEGTRATTEAYTPRLTLGVPIPPIYEGTLRSSSMTTTLHPESQTPNPKS